VLACCMAAPPPAQAQEFSRQLLCSGHFGAKGQTTPAHVDLALRFNSRTALVQRSNVLPVGEVLNYVPTPASYAMTYLRPVQGTRVLVVPGWLDTTVVVLQPDLKRLNQIRLSIDRQTGALEAQMLNEADRVLGTLAMQCRSVSEAESPAPRF
jgi:hypothetical protein